jgi:hypothetical protein
MQLKKKRGPTPYIHSVQSALFLKEHDSISQVYLKFPQAFAHLFFSSFLT